VIRLLQAFQVWRALHPSDHPRDDVRPVYVRKKQLLPLERMAVEARLLHDTAVCAMLNGSGTYDEFLADLPGDLCPCRGAIEDPGPKHLPRCRCSWEDEPPDFIPF
jgi:hypothetical protein